LFILLWKVPKKEINFSAIFLLGRTLFSLCRGKLSKDVKRKVRNNHKKEFQPPSTKFEPCLSPHDLNPTAKSFHLL